MSKVTVTITCDRDIFDELCSYPDSRLEIKNGPIPVGEISMEKAKENLNKAFGIRSQEAEDPHYSIIGMPVVYIPTQTWGYIAEIEIFRDTIVYCIALADGSFIETCKPEKIFPDTTHERLGKPTNKDICNAIEVTKWYQEVRKEKRNEWSL